MVSLRVVIAGSLDGARALAPPPDSWAAGEDSHIAIWTLKLAPGATWTAPPASSSDANRVFYFFEGAELFIDGEPISLNHAVQVVPDAAVTLTAGDTEAEVLMLQGRPIGEPVVNHGPFVMNTMGEIRQTMLEYQSRGFGEWKLKSSAPVHPREQSRFAIHADGRREQP